MLKLRPWQEEARSKAINWLVSQRKDKHFLINAAPGAGKTICASAIAKNLFDMSEIDRVVVIAPRKQVVLQWAKDFKIITTRHMTKVTGSDNHLTELDLDICATWSAIQGLMKELQILCSRKKVLVICDEHHHAAVSAAWGSSADSALHQAKYVVVLTGTPIRSDGSEAVWLAYDDKGVIQHPEEGTYTLNYGEAVDLGYCRPATFHRHRGKFTVDLGGEKIEVSGQTEPRVPKSMKGIPGLKAAVDWYRLAKTPQFNPRTKEPNLEGYQASMIEAGIEKLADTRLDLPKAGGLVIAPTIEMAIFMADILEAIDGEKPLLVHSEQSNAEDKIEAFKHSDKKWLVSVNMVSEGVDIPRLRVLVYLPNALTELAFRQAIGRVVRTFGYDDISRAYVVMPAFKRFEKFAKRIEDEMPLSAKNGIIKRKQKTCPVCGLLVPLGQKVCECGHHFAQTGGFTPTGIKICSNCHKENSKNAERCSNCGQSFLSEFDISLNEALRVGAIARGLELEEEEVRKSEQISKRVKELILRSGDEKIINLLKVLPEESWSRLQEIVIERE